jgi:hypothetical protein
MTTKPKTRRAPAPARAPKQRRAHVVTEAEAAALNFEPWQGDVDTERLPNNKQFIEHGLDYLMTCRLALAMMAEMLGQIENEDGFALMNGFLAAKKTFSRAFPSFLARPRGGSSSPGPPICRPT